MNKSKEKKTTIFNVPLIAWQHAKKAFKGDQPLYILKQQFKSLFGALIHPIIASVWFDKLQSPSFAIIIANRPRLYIKPFRVYMSIKWNVKQKVKVIIDTYKYILSNGNFSKVITNNDGVNIATLALSDTISSNFVFGFDNNFRKEGEMVLSMRCEEYGGTIVSGAFSFEEVKPNEWICRIGCIQGHRMHQKNASKSVQKLYQGMRPKAVIIYAIQEIVRNLNFSAVYGAGDSIQAYRKKHAIHLHWKHKIQFDYNAVWEEAGGLADNHGWYKLPSIPKRKNIEDVKSKKRAVYRRRYILLDQLSDQISKSIINLLDNK